MVKRQAVSAPLGTWAERLPESFLACRDMGHSWRPYTAGFDAVARLYRRSLRCQRCKTERVQTLSTSGVIESSHYVYPDDYLAPSGSGVMDSAGRAMLRLLDVTRQVEQAESRGRGAA